VQAIRDVSLEIQQQDYVAITGPSGSGKSTLLYLASGLDKADAGTVLFEGSVPASSAEWTRLRATRIGFVFQSFQLIAGLTSVENVELPMFGVTASEKVRRERATALLERVSLGSRTNHRIAELSGGEAQRVAIARALANSPSVILADEPTGNLDSQTANQILNLLEDVHTRERVALVIVTHDASIAGRATRVLKLRDGGLIGEERRKEPA
jgi:putative ABC transport system ATP-binding protein